MWAMVAMAAAIFVLVFSNSLEMLFAGELVCGIPWGIFRASGPTESEDHNKLILLQKH